MRSLSGNRLNALALLLGILSTVTYSSAEETPAESPPGNEDSKVSYHKDVEPIFRRNCLGCHQGAKQLGGYLMTNFESMVAGGESEEPAIVPGDPDKSYLVARITPVDGVAEMPEPPAKPLSDVEIETIRKWIEQGAVNDSPVDSGPTFSSDNPPVYNAPSATTSISGFNSSKRRFALSMRGLPNQSVVINN